MIKLKEYRINFKMSQEQVSSVLGVTQQQYSRLENGTSVLNVNQILILCKLYSITPNDLLNAKYYFDEATKKWD